MEILTGITKYLYNNNNKKEEEIKFEIENDEIIKKVKPL
jgi:hypothetical protein